MQSRGDEVVEKDTRDAIEESKQEALVQDLYKIIRDSQAEQERLREQLRNEEGIT